MTTLAPYELFVAASCLLVGYLALSTWLENTSKHELPGPLKVPLIGNLVVPGRLYEKMAIIGRKHGPIFGGKLFSTKFVMVNSVAVARELLETRSSIYSFRLPLKMAEMCGYHKGIVFEQDASKLRQGRKLVAFGLAQREMEKYRHIYEAHTVNFLSCLLQTPERFLHHGRQLPVGLILEISYGYKVKGEDDPVCKKSEEWVERFAACTGFSGFLVNWFPILDQLPGWFPGTKFKQLAVEWKEKSEAFTWDSFYSVKSAVERGDALPSVISKVLSETPEEYDDDAIAYSAGQIMAGGADTSVCSIASFMLAMVLHPEVQKKGQAEIDRVIGRNRLPTIKDWDDLPYITGIVREVIRWNPAVPLLFRNPIEDDVYEGYVIKKDTMVFFNYWAMLHNTEHYPDHAAFRPERWAEMELNKENDPFEIAFGFGRRICPGRASSKQLLFTVISAVLATLDISPEKDAQGRDILPKEDFTDGGIVGPKPFNATILPRSEHARQLIEDAVQALQ